LQIFTPRKGKLTVATYAAQLVGWHWLARNGWISMPMVAHPCHAGSPLLFLTAPIRTRSNKMRTNCAPMLECGSVATVFRPQESPSRHCDAMYHKSKFVLKSAKHLFIDHCKAAE
jgi:hypothetical protein